MANKKIAIACQGGGSHTAFTAGVLKTFYKNGVFDQYDVVSFSGTSGGAICAALSWYSLLNEGKNESMKMDERLENFWMANSTHDYWMPFYWIREFQNNTLINLMRMVDKGFIREWKLSPGSWITQMLQRPCRLFAPKFYDLESMLRKHIVFDTPINTLTPDSPVLLIGSTNLLTSESKIFNSYKDKIEPDSIIASAAIPSVFEPVEIENQFYWDGLYSQNPPIVPLTEAEYVGKDRIPDEIWVIQINPVKKSKIPENLSEIKDRENELIGNISLLQGLEYIENMNEMLENGSLTNNYIKNNHLRKTDLYTIPMSEKFQNSLDLPSKLDRRRSFISALIKDGESQGENFIKNPSKFIYKKNRAEKVKNEKPMRVHLIQKNIDIKYDERKYINPGGEKDTHN